MNSIILCNIKNTTIFQSKHLSFKGKELDYQFYIDITNDLDNDNTKTVPISNFLRKKSMNVMNYFIKILLSYNNRTQFNMYIKNWVNKNETQ